MPDLRFLPECPSHAEVVDETTGAVDFVVELADDCKEPAEYPNELTFIHLDDTESVDVICDSPGPLVYEAVELGPENLQQALFDPTDQTVGIPVDGATVEDGDWVRVSYWQNHRDGGSSEGPWTVLFQLGIPGSGFNNRDCYLGD